MKDKLSISVEDNLIKKIDKEIEKGLFRNKSHLVEYAVNKFLEDKDNGI